MSDARSQHGTHQVSRVGIEDQQRMQNVVSVIPMVEGELLLTVSVVVGTFVARINVLKQIQDDLAGTSTRGLFFRERT